MAHYEAERQSLNSEEEIRREYETCPHCEADLSAWSSWLATCPLCGGMLPSPTKDVDKRSTVLLEWFMLPGLYSRLRARYTRAGGP
jgi:hypothetical protein